MPSHDLGPFALDRPIGAGGMAVVWRGRHRATETPVAVKLLTSAVTKRHLHRRALENEVRAMARLDHPGVIAVLDIGEVPAEAASPSEGLLEGSPFLVMELANAGPLTRRGVTSYEDIRSVLRGLLRALAHAHSRGVIHRDLKPSNVLFDEPTGPPRLTDFGIAHAIGRAETGTGGAPLNAGTAWFMAPEQVLGLHRDEGPGTDLYALGCLAYLVICGRPPYPSKARDAVYRAHCLADIPALQPRFRVPSELDAWIRILLAKVPTDRFRCAADAAAALEQLGGPWLEPLASGPAESDARHGSEEETFAEDAPTRFDMVQRFAQSTAPRTRDGSRLRRVRPVIPERPPTGPRPTPARLLGVGLGVHGLRAIPFAGRQAERERLWRCLVDVERDGKPRAMVIRGRAGLGKTRLTEWLVELASERGAARVLWVLHDREPSAFDGPSRMLRRALRLEGLDRLAIDGRLAELLPDLDEATRIRLAAWLSPSADAGPGMPLDERHAIATELLEHMSERCPVMLVFDDVPHGPESVALVRHLMRSRARVLAILTAREETLESLPDRAEQLAELLKRPGVSEVVLEPLPKRAHVELIEGLIGLGPELAKTVAERTIGSPLFAVQLVGDWVQRGILQPTDQGFALAGEVPAIPDDLHALWTARVEGLLASFPEPRRDDVRRSLRVMAALGRAALRGEWESACRELGLEPDERLLERMAARRLARVGRARYSLVHGMLHESLERGLRERGQAAPVHIACARALIGLYAKDDLHAERIARHLDEAGERRDAARYFLRAANAKILSCDFADARRLAERHDAILDELGVERDDAARLDSLLVHAEVTGIRAQLEENERILTEAESLARRLGSQRLAPILWLRGGLALKRGEFGPADALFTEGVERSKAQGDMLNAARCLHGRGEAEKLLGEIDLSIAHYQAASATFTELGEALGFGRARMGIADVYRRQGDIERSAEVLEEAVYWMRRWGNRHSAAVGVNGLGDLARIRGQLDVARGHYEEAMRLFDSLDSAEAMLVRLNLGLVLLATDEHRAAADLFAETRPRLEAIGRPGYMAYVLAGEMAASAGLGEWDAVEARQAELDEILAHAGLVDDDLAWCLERVGELAAEAGHTDRARDAYAATIAQWEGLERDDAAARVRERLDALTDS